MPHLYIEGERHSLYVFSLLQEKQAHAMPNTTPKYIDPRPSKVSPLLGHMGPWPWSN